jgi:hypothetical protein
MLLHLKTRIRGGGPNAGTRKKETQPFAAADRDSRLGFSDWGSGRAVGEECRAGGPNGDPGAGPMVHAVCRKLGKDWANPG